MDKKTHGKIISALRKLTYAYPPRNEVKKAAKVAKKHNKKMNKK